MTSVLSVNVATAAAKAAPQAAGVTPASQTSQIPNAAQVAQTSQAAVNHVAAQVELSSKKTIQQPPRAEGTFEPEKEEEKKGSTADKDELDGETPYRTLDNPVNIVA